MAAVYPGTDGGRAATASPWQRAHTSRPTSTISSSRAQAPHAGQRSHQPSRRWALSIGPWSVMAAVYAAAAGGVVVTARGTARLASYGSRWPGARDRGAWRAHPARLRRRGGSADLRAAWGAGRV